MNWQKALDLHIDLFGYVDTADFRERLHNFILAYDPRQDDWNALEYVDAMYDVIHANLNEGPTYFVAGDIMPLIQEAANEMSQPTMAPQMLRPWDLPTRSGFVVFERNWRYKDFDIHLGEIGDLLIRAVSWGPALVGRSIGDNQRLYNDRRLHDPLLQVVEENGVMFHLWIDSEEWRRLDAGISEHDNTYQRAPGPMTLVDMLPWSHYCPWNEAASGPILDRMNEQEVNTAVQHAKALNVTNQVTQLDVDADWPVDAEGRPVILVRGHVAEFRRFILSFGRFMEQRILQPEELFPGRPGQKRWEHRFGKPIDGERAKVLVLRRIDHEAMRLRPGDKHGTNSGVQARHRVGAHWHKYFYRSRGLPVGHPDAYDYKYLQSYEKGTGILEEKHAVTAVIR